MGETKNAEFNTKVQANLALDFVIKQHNQIIAKT